MNDPKAREEGRVLALMLRASVRSTSESGVAEVELVEKWAKLGPLFRPALDRLREQGLIEPALNGVRLTAAGRGLIQRIATGTERPRP
jgi:ribosomal protein S19E (S16A)